MKVIGHLDNNKTVSIGFNQLLDIFHRIPYIATSKQCIHDFMKMTIICQEKTYEGHRYFHTTVKGLPITSEQRLVIERLRENIYARIKEYKKESVLDITDFEEL